VQNNTLFLFVYYCVSPWRNQTTLSIDLEENVAICPQSDPALGQKDNWFVTFALGLSMMIDSNSIVLTVKFILMNAKNKLVFESVEQWLLDVAGHAFLVDDDSSSLSAFDSVEAWYFLNIAYFLIINVIVLRIIKVILIISEVFQPRLIIGDNFPVAFPYLFASPSGIVFIN